MTTWTLPLTIEQYEEDISHIAWYELDGFSNLKTLNGIGTSTVSPLLHISRQPRNDIKMQTYFLRITGFNFLNLPETVSGIQFKLTMNRGGRITDETVQLCFNGDLIGENRAGLNLDPIQIYGSDTDSWGVDNLTLGMIQDPSFGIVVRFQSHPGWPHKTTPIVKGVELKIV